MKSHADALSPTLSTLSSSFDSMSKLESQLRASLLPLTAPSSSPPTSSSSNGTSPISVQTHLLPIVTLPQRLRDIIALGQRQRPQSQSGEADSEETPPDAGLPAAEALWGRHEAVLSAWAGAGIPGAEAIAADCRLVLREERERQGGQGRPQAAGGAGQGAE